MKVIGFWIIIATVCGIAVFAIENIDDISSVIRHDSLWWHIPAFLLCLYTVVNSGLAILNRVFG